MMMELSNGNFALFVLLICQLGLGVVVVNANEEQQLVANSGMDDFSDSLSSRYAKDILFRPVRRIGSEFLGKRATWLHLSPDQEEELLSQGVGKRRLGSEFLGKRSMDDNGEVSDYEDDKDERVKRKIGSEFLGKRGRFAQPVLDWSWKRARLGSEFLGKRKRALGSEFLGKRMLPSSLL